MSANEKLLDTIKKLLALGTSPVPAEAAAAMAKANELMLRHNLSIVDVNDHDLKDYTEFEVDYDFALDTKYVRHILKSHFFVEILLSPYQKKWMIIGTKQNVEIAHFMVGHIKSEFASAWEKYKRENGIVGIQGKTDFYYGMFKGLHEKLESEKERLKQEEGLVWLGDPKIKEFLAKIHPRIKQGDKAKQRMSGDAEARAAGFEAGVNMKLNKGISHGASRQHQIGGK